MNSLIHALTVFFLFLNGLGAGRIQTFPLTGRSGAANRNGIIPKVHLSGKDKPFASDSKLAGRIRKDTRSRSLDELVFTTDS